MDHPTQSRLVRRIGATTAGVLLTGGAVLALPVTASAAAAPTPFTASATSALLHVQALTGLPAANLVLGPAIAGADSSKGAGASTADGANLDALVLGALSLNNVLTDISQSSTPGVTRPPATGQLLAVPAAPLATAGVGTASASATDVSNGVCPIAGSPVSSAYSEVAGASVLPGVAGVGDAVDVQQTVRSTGTTQLTTVAGQTGQAVTSTATSGLTSLSLLGGSVIVSVAHAPTLTTVATGTPGSSSVTYSAPVVTVTIGGGTSQTLSAPGQGITIPGLGTLSLGALTKTVGADGTSATGSASLLHLDLSPAGLQVATVDLVPLTAAATVPSGGVLCAAGTGGVQVVTPTPTPTPTTSSTPTSSPTAPSGTTQDPFGEFHKGLSAATVNAGRSFSSPLTLSNRATCTITDATVTDVVKGGLILQSATPSPSASGNGSYTYGPFTLAPGQVLTVAQTFGVPVDATVGTKYGDTATITGTCDGVAATGTSTVSGPTVDAAGTGACNLSRSDLTSDHLQVAGGEQFNDEIDLFNTGGAACTGVQATETLPTGTTFVSCTGGCTLSGNTVTWLVGTLDPGASRSLTVTLLAPAAQAAGAAPRSLVAAGTVTANGGVKVSLLTERPALTGTSVLSPLTPASRGTGKPASVEAKTAEQLAYTDRATKASKVTQPRQQLAYTGMPGIAFPALLVIVLAGAGGLLRRRSTRMG